MSDCVSRDIVKIYNRDVSPSRRKTETSCVGLSSKRRWAEQMGKKKEKTSERWRARCRVGIGSRGSMRERISFRSWNNAGMQNLRGIDDFKIVRLTLCRLNNRRRHRCCRRRQVILLPISSRNSRYTDVWLSRVIFLKEKRNPGWKRSITDRHEFNCEVHDARSSANDCTSREFHLPPASVAATLAKLEEEVVVVEKEDGGEGTKWRLRRVMHT